MSGVAREEQASVLHGLANTHAVVEDVALDELAALDRRSTRGGEAVFQFCPDPVVRPVFESVTRGHLEHETRRRRRSMHLPCETAPVKPVDRPAGRGRDGSDQRQPTERVGGGDLVDPGGEGTRSTIAARDNLAPDRDFHPGRGDNRAHLRPVFVLFDAGRLDSEPNIAARRDQLLGPISDELLLRIDVVTAPVAERRVVEDERLPVCPELTRTDPVPPSRMVPARPCDFSNSTVRCSIIPAFIRERSRSASCRSSTTNATPARWRTWATARPAGPAPTTHTTGSRASISDREARIRGDRCQCRRPARAVTMSESGARLVRVAEGRMQADLSGPGRSEWSRATTVRRHVRSGSGRR